MLGVGPFFGRVFGKELDYLLSAGCFENITDIMVFTTFLVFGKFSLGVILKVWGVPLGAFWRPWGHF